MLILLVILIVERVLLGFLFTLGGTAISWASNLQKIVTLSTTKTEYVASTEARKEMIWLHGFLDELGKK